MKGMTAGTIETLRITDNIRNTAVLLATITAMLKARFHRLAESGQLTAGVQSGFHKGLAVVERCIDAMQNCAEKPPLGRGSQLVDDQVAIMNTPYAVEQLFEVMGLKPKVEAGIPSVTFISTNEHAIADFHVRTGIKIVFNGVQG